jgi:hypothetical protein
MSLHWIEVSQAATKMHPSVGHNQAVHPNLACIVVASSKGEPSCEPELVQEEKPSHHINASSAIPLPTWQHSDAPPCLNPEDLLRSSDDCLGVAESAAANTDAGDSTFAARRVLQLPRIEHGRLIRPQPVPIACAEPGCEGHDCAGGIHPHHHGPDSGAHHGGAASMPAWELLETCDPVEIGDDLLASANRVWGHSTLLDGCSCEQRLAQ